MKTEGFEEAISFLAAEQTDLEPGEENAGSVHSDAVSLQMVRR